MSSGSSRGQSEPLGMGLLFAITILGAAAVVALGATAIASTQQNAEVDHAQQSMTQFDSTASQVALGSSNVRSVSFGGSGGSYSVQPNAGEIRIVHVNYDGTNDDGNAIWDGTGDTDDVAIYNKNLGAIVYENGDRTVAYQGGGVWTKTDSGGSSMVSPPEFHYRGATLTLPIIRVSGSGGAKGNPTATIEQTTSGESVFPASETYPNGNAYVNPQKKGNFEVVVESKYYEAWESYFDQRTAGVTTTTDIGAPGGVGRVTVELVSLGAGTGNFNLPNEGGTVEFRGLDNSHAVNEFRLKIRPTDADSSDFNDLQWSLYAEDGQKQLEIHLRDNAGSGCDGADPTTADVVIYYTDDGGSTYEGWVAENAFTAKCDGDGDIYFEIDLTSATSMTYSDLGSDDSLSTTPPKPGQGSLSTGPINAHPSHPERTYSAGETENMAFLLRHYIANFGSSIEFEVYDKNGNGGSVGEGPSTGYIDYGGSGQYVTFLHVTENEIEVEFN